MGDSLFFGRVHDRTPRFSVMFTNCGEAVIWGGLVGKVGIGESRDNWIYPALRDRD